MNRLKCFLIFLSFGQFAQAQNQYAIWRFSTDPTHLLVNNFGVKAELQMNSISFGLYLGVKIASKESARLSGGSNVGSGYTFANFFNPVNNGITIGLNNRYYIKDPVVGFIDFSIFYRHWWIDDKYMEFENRDAFKGVRREQQNIYGFKFLLGETIPFRKKGHIRPFLDIAGGLGVRLKTGVFETFNGEINDRPFNYHQIGLVEWWPSLHLSFCFGMDIYK